MNRFLTSNETSFRLLRTILQGVIGVIIANIDLIMGQVVLDPAQRAIVVPIVMAILSPIMSTLGESMTYKAAVDGVNDDGKEE